MRYYRCPGCNNIWTDNELCEFLEITHYQLCNQFHTEGACLNYGSGEPSECMWEDELDDITDRPIIIMSPAGFLYGTISSITWNIMIVNTTHRRRWDTVIKKWKSRRYLTQWERIDPPRKMLAIGGRVVNIEPPKGRDEQREEKILG